MDPAPSDARGRRPRSTVFLTRKFPPQRGGMETAAANLHGHLAAIRPVRLVKYGRPNSWLPIVIPLLAIRGLVNGWRPSTDAILLQDGVLAPIGVLLGALTRKPVLIIIHGLEVTHSGGVLRRLMSWSLPRMSHVIAVSAHTRELIAARFPAVPITVVNNGVPDDFVSALSRQELDSRIGELAGLPSDRVAASTVIATIGRLVPRKGVRWFTEAVLPMLGDDYLYLVVGAGREHDAIVLAAERAGVADRVRMLGRVEGADLNVVLTRSDVFVMPNIRVEGDVEGFGIAAVEASSAGTPVVAARVDGIPDAVRTPGNGILVTAGDADAFTSAIAAVDSSPAARAAIRAFTLEQFSWDACARTVSQLIDEVAAAERAS